MISVALFPFFRTTRSNWRVITRSLTASKPPNESGHHSLMCFGLQPERQFASCSMLTGRVEDSNGTLALISKPAARAAMARAANMPSKIGVNTPSAQIVGGNVLHLLGRS
jgi:hypothetical protein